MVSTDSFIRLAHGKGNGRGRWWEVRLTLKQDEVGTILGLADDGSRGKHRPERSEHGLMVEPQGNRGGGNPQLDKYDVVVNLPLD